MKSVSRACLAMMVLALLVGGCKKKNKAPPAGGHKVAVKAATRTPAPQVTVPREVLAHVGLRAPGKTIDDGLALVRKFVPVMQSRQMLLDQLADNIRIPREVMTTLDLAGTCWLVMLDDKLAKTQNGNVVVIPISSKESFQKAMAKRMQQAGTEGKLTVYKPKPGQVGLQPVRLLISDNNVIVATEKKALELTESFIRGNLMGATPAHSLAANVMVSHLIKSRGDELDRGVNSALGQLRHDMKGRSGPLGQLPAEATDRTIKQYLAMFKDTTRVLVGLDITREQLTITLKGRAKTGGKLHKVIKRQRPGAALAMANLPATSWLVLSDRGNPEAQKEGEGLLKPLLEEFFKEMDPKQRKTATGHLSTIVGTFSGDYTLALHQAPSGKGITLSSITSVTDAAAAGKATQKLVVLVRKWIKAEMRRRNDKMPEGFKLAHEAFKHKGARGTIFRLTYPASPGKEKEAKMLNKLLGNPFTLGWAYADKKLLFVLGKETKRQLELLIEGKPRGKSLAQKPDFVAARQGTGRVGQLYISLVDFIRWFEGSGNADMEKVIEGLEGRKVTSAPSLSWGVSDDRTEIDFTLRLPAEHFLTFKPAADKMMQKNLPAEMIPRDILQMKKKK